MPNTQQTRPPNRRGHKHYQKPMLAELTARLTAGGMMGMNETATNMMLTRKIIGS